MTLERVDLGTGEVEGQLEPSWSRSGALAYTSGGRVYVLSGGRRSDRGPGIEPALAPDGSRLAVLRGNDLYVDGHSALLLPTGTFGAAFSPVSDICPVLRAAAPLSRAQRDSRVLRNSFNGPVAGTCEVRGTPGNDTIEGTSLGGDVILAGAGNDRAYARNGHRDVVDCGPGRDVAWVDRSDSVTRCEVVHR